LPGDRFFITTVQISPGAGKKIGGAPAPRRRERNSTRGHTDNDMVTADGDANAQPP